VEAFEQAMTEPNLWLAIVEIIWINILLSGDNAVVIALACRSLPQRQRFWGMVIGAGAAAILRIGFAGIITELMLLPFVKMLGGVALVWIAVKLLAPQGDDDDAAPEAGSSLWRAVRIVVVADLVMSLDNVIAIAAVAKGRYVLLIIGLAISIPMVIAGSALIFALLQRLPILVWGGAAVLGWVAGDIFADDPVVGNLLGRFASDDVELAAKIAGAVVVLAAGAIGYAIRKRRPARDRGACRSDAE
jgi:YjbE family integral membrane protein